MFVKAWTISTAPVATQKLFLPDAAAGATLHILKSVCPALLRRDEEDMLEMQERQSTERVWYI